MIASAADCSEYAAVGTLSLVLHFPCFILKGFDADLRRMKAILILCCARIHLHTGKARRTWKPSRGSMAYPSLTPKCSKNGRSFRKRPGTEITVNWAGYDLRCLLLPSNEINTDSVLKLVSLMNTCHVIKCKTLFTDNDAKGVFVLAVDKQAKQERLHC